MKKNIFGFSLTEILTVLVIVGILVGASVPIYRDRVVRTRVEAHLIPVLYAYRDKLENLLLEGISTSGTCFIDQLANYDASASTNKMIEWVHGKYVAADNQHVIQIGAKMFSSSSDQGIGISQIGSNRLKLELIMTKNGEAVSWTCGSDTTYKDYVPYVCQQYYGIETGGSTWGPGGVGDAFLNDC